MLKKIIISLVILAVILSIFTSSLVSAALALFAFSILVYYAIAHNSHQ